MVTVVDNSKLLGVLKSTPLYDFITPYWLQSSNHLCFFPITLHIFSPPNLHLLFLGGALECEHWFSRKIRLVGEQLPDRVHLSRCLILLTGLVRSFLKSVRV